MKALISAAGLGSRIGKLTKDTNKCLLEVGGTPLLRHAFNTLADNGIDDVYIIVGYHADKIKEEFGDEVTYIYNKNYASTSILGSVGLAKKYIAGDEFIFMTGDSFMHPNVIRDFLKEDGDVLASIELKDCDEEDYKVVLKGGKIVTMSKDIPLDQADGEFTAMIKLSASASKRFFENVDLALNNQSDDKFVADMVLRLQEQGFDTKPVFSNEFPRIEIDFEEDLARAQEMYAKQKGFDI